MEENNGERRASNSRSSERQGKLREPARCEASIEIKAKSFTSQLAGRPYRPILKQLLRGKDTAVPRNSAMKKSEYAGQAKRTGDVEPKGSRTMGEKRLKFVAGI